MTAAFEAVQLPSVTSHLALVGCSHPGFHGAGPLSGRVWDCDNPFLQRDDGTGTCGLHGVVVPLFVSTEYESPSWSFTLHEEQGSKSGERLESTTSS